MAHTQVVKQPSALEKQVKKFLQTMSREHGDFVLAMLVPSQAGLSDRWNLVLSAPWIDRGGLAATIPTITSSLVEHLSGANAHKLERISVLPTSDQFVVRLMGLGVPLGEIHQLLYFPQVEGAVVFQAGLAEHSHAHRIQQVSTHT
jgi:hypothetical protein